MSKTANILKLTTITATTVCSLFIINKLGDIIFSKDKLNYSGSYAVENMQKAETSSKTDKNTDKTVNINVDTTDTKDTRKFIINMLAKANVKAGKKFSKKCAACHSFDKGGRTKVGPNLYNIINRQIASIEGFKYSEPMKNKATEIGIWNYNNLVQFLHKPKEYIPNTKMGYAGVKKDKDLANLIAYLRTLSDTPATLPNENDDEQSSNN